MAFPTCIEIPTPPPPKEITFIGGATLTQIVPAGSQVPDNLDGAMNLLSQAAPIMASAKPFLDLLDAFLAVFKVVQAIPDSLGPPPDPSAIVAVLPDAVKKVDAVLKLIPQLSVPIMIVGIIDCIIQVLTGVRDSLAAIVEQLARVADAEAKAAELGDANLQVVVDCANANVGLQLKAMGDSLGPINQLIGVLNIFTGLIGLPSVPELGDALASGDPEASLAPLDEAVTLLTNLRSAVPVP